MANRLEQPSKRDEKYQTGCIHGFISILDFRHGRSTRRLREDTTTGIEVAGAVYSRSILKKLLHSYRHSRKFYDGEGKDSLIAGVKELMEDEVFGEQEQNEPSSAHEQAKEFDSESKGCVKTNPKRTSTTTKSFCDMNCELDAARTIGSENDIHQDSEKEANLDAKCGRNNDFDIRFEQTCSLFYGKVIEAIKVFLNQRLTTGKHLTEYEKTEHTNEFMNALQTLSSNKELILKLLQDPNSLLVKRIEDLEDAQLEKDQNPNTIAKYCLINRDLKVSKPAERAVWKQHFFRRKSKSREKVLLREQEDGQTSNRMVILKPGPVSARISQPESKLLPLRPSHRKVQTKRIASRFFFTRIKRKLKHAMGKERHKVPSDDISRRFLCEHQNSGCIGKKSIGREKVGWNSPNRSHFCNEKLSIIPININNKDKSCKPYDTETSMGIGKRETEYSKLRVYCNDLYIEANKHLSEMLSDGNKIEDFSSKQLPKTLGRILSLPYFNSSPNCVSGQKRFLRGNCFHNDSWQLMQDEDVFHLGPSRGNSISRSCTAENTVQSSNLKSDVLGVLSNTNAVESTLSSLKHEKSIEADVETVEITDASVSEESKFFDISVEQCSCSVIRDEQDGDLTEVCNVDDYAQFSTLDSFEEGLLLSSPLPSLPNSSIINLVGDLDRSNERRERPSPVSVLDPSFTDDYMSPSILKSQPVELSLQPQKIIFDELSSSAANQETCARSCCMENEESSCDYVEAVLLASDLNWADFLSRWLASDQILDVSLFHEVELFSNRSQRDQKLLFDCTNEVLEEVCDRYFGISPWVSFVKHNIRPIPRGKRLLLEVWDGVEWYIPSHSYSSTLEQIVGRDMYKTGTWMDLGFDVENICIELGEAIFEELVDEIIWTFII